MSSFRPKIEPLAINTGISVDVEDLLSRVMSNPVKEEDNHDSTPPTPPYMSLPEEILEIHVGEDGSRFCLVKWFGFSLEETTWESESHLNEIALCSTYLMDQYNKKMNRQGNAESEGQVQQSVQKNEGGANLYHIDYGMKRLGLENTPGGSRGMSSQDGEKQMVTDVVMDITKKEVWRQPKIEFHE